MPVNKIVATKRGKAAVAAAIIAAAIGGWQSHKDTTPAVLPPALILATDSLILPWEGLVLQSHWDRYAKIYDICSGLTKINGKPVTAGMRFTKPQCMQMTREQVYQNFYLPLVKQVPGFVNFPVGVQAAMLSGAYNFGVGSYAKTDRHGRLDCGPSSCGRPVPQGVRSPDKLQQGRWYHRRWLSEAP